MKKAYFVRTDKGIEVVTDVVQMRPDSMQERFQIMWEDSEVGSGNFCYDYIDYVDTSDQIVLFLDRNIQHLKRA